MLFNSLTFLVFLPVVLGLYHVARSSLRAQNALLLVASYVFYGWWDWRFLSLILLSTAVDFAVGRGLARTDDDRARKRLLFVSLGANLGLLAFFKYFGFFVDSAIDAFASLGIQASAPTLSIVLPVGISFYTFQTLSYTIDVYRRRLEPTDDALTFALFVAFFPQLVAGPIERASHLLPSLSKPRHVTGAMVESGVWLMAVGFLKKVVVADNLGLLVDQVYASGAEPSAGAVWLGTLAFAFQIYADFSGYSDIARGTSRLFGIELMQNFDAPYFSRNIQEFWRRWHISLSTWLRDYLYVPLGGNRRGPVRTYVNLMLTMILGGLWHGAGWNWVAWGTWHGGWLALHRRLRGRHSDRPPHAAPLAWQLLSAVGTFALVLYSWVLFRAHDMGHAIDLSVRAFSAGGEPLVAASQAAHMAPLIAGVVLLDAWQQRTRTLCPMMSWPAPARVLLLATCVVAVVLFGSFHGQYFIYFQF